MFAFFHDRYLAWGATFEHLSKVRDYIVFTCLFLFMMFNLRVYRDFVRFRNALIEEISVLTGLVVNYGVWAVKFGMILFFCCC